MDRREFLRDNRGANRCVRKAPDLRRRHRSVSINAVRKAPTASHPAPAREPPHVGNQFRLRRPEGEDQRIQPYTVRSLFRSCAQRGAQGEAPGPVEQLGAAHTGPARGDEHGDRRRQGVGGAAGRQRESNKFEAVGHAGGGEGIPVFPILAENRRYRNGAANLWLAPRPAAPCSVVASAGCAGR
jgi:hypothetical protein